VVATEVRTLSQRSATAAREVNVLLQDSGQKVQDGAALVNRSGQTLTEIRGAVQQVTAIIAEIAAASQEQTGGIVQVQQALAQIDQVTQENVAQVEELIATARMLAARAQDIQTLVGRFHVHDITARAEAETMEEDPLVPLQVTRRRWQQAEPIAAFSGGTGHGAVHGMARDFADV
jgi:hypothetical protein